MQTIIQNMCTQHNTYHNNIIDYFSFGMHHFVEPWWLFLFFFLIFFLFQFSIGLILDDQFYCFRCMYMQWGYSILLAFYVLFSYLDCVFHSISSENAFLFSTPFPFLLIPRRNVQVKVTRKHFRLGVGKTNRYNLQTVISMSFAVTDLRLLNGCMIW